jgi:ubiquinone/menaquinone biosynthesis C-methylase UbiE
MNTTTEALTERQQRELDYHREYAKQYEYMLEQDFRYEVTQQTTKTRRWWSSYWEMYWFLANQNLNQKKVMVVGCGFGEDALRLAKMGADVYAFDLSPESLQIAAQVAKRENLSITFDEMPAEQLSYAADFFDLVLARDILHHVDIPAAMQEIVRVSKNDALFVYNEVYSHSMTNIIRHSNLVEETLYPLMEGFVYDNANRYITEDERKLSEHDCDVINQVLDNLVLKKYFYFIVNRVIPEKYDILNQTDRAMLIAFGYLGRYLAGRTIVAGTINKSITLSSAD